MPREAYYGTYVYDMGDDRMNDATEMLREWKNAKRMGKDTIAPDRFNAGYDEGYIAWLKRDIQNISIQILCSFRSVTDKEAKAVAELRELREETNEVYAKLVENQDALERATREIERLKKGYEEFDNWIQQKIERMRYESLEDKGRLGEGFLLMLRYMFQQHKNAERRRRSRTIRSSIVDIAPARVFLCLYLHYFSPCVGLILLHLLK